MNRRFSNSQDLSPRLLVISFAYPPSAAPRAVQVARLLANLDHKILLLCADFDDPKDRTDENLARDLPDDNLTVVRVPFARSTWDIFIARATDALKLPIINKTPDAFTKWKPDVLKAVNAVASDNSFDALVTFGAPMSDHLIGLKLKRRIGIPWVAHFSDPWVDNPFTSTDPITNAVNRSLERKVLSNVDRAVFTSSETVELVFAKYPSIWKDRARVIPHSFDPALFGQFNKRYADKITIRYLGDFYGPRTPQPLFQAVQEMLQLDSDSLKDVQFELIGNLGNSSSTIPALLSLPTGLVTVKSSVDYASSLSFMTEADGLLVIDAPSERSVFLPSKLIDYVGAQRPIFGITPPGTAANLISELGGWVADPAQSIKVREQLEAFIAFLRARKGKSAPPWGNPAVRSRFEHAVVSRAFSEIVCEVARR